MPLPIHWQTAGHIRFADIRKRLETATLMERYELLTFVRMHRARIRPRVADRWLMLEMLRYLLECIAVGNDSDKDADEEDFDTPSNAVWQMVKFFNWYRSTEKDAPKVQNIADMIADFYRNGNNFCRSSIETGFLGRVLETPENRSFFEGWAADPVLADAHRESLQRGVAHEATDEPE